MRRFSYQRAASLDEAIALLSATSRPLAGGTELLTELKAGLARPEQLVSLRDIPGMREIAVQPEGGVRIGALVPLAALERSALIAGGPYHALAQAAQAAASPQLRNMATLGGNLLQDSRCWYYRSGLHCWYAGGEHCGARHGENHMHAIFDRSPCVAVQPSDPATALVALGAHVLIAGPGGQRRLAVAELLAPPTPERRRLHTLAPDELIVAVELPDRAGWRSVYQKATERASYAFALASVAVALKLDGDTVTDAQVVLGGVANTPVVVEAARSLVGTQLEAASIAVAAEQALAGAAPLVHNGYKVVLARGLMGTALAAIGAEAHPVGG